ncbi:MAG: DUF4405 domain-containing protein [Ignavibacteriaceae bacterium]
MDKRKKLLTFDILLIPGFLTTAISGLNLHVANKGFNSIICGISLHGWTIIHVSAALLFLAISGMHIYQHWGWFKQLFISAKNKSRITITTAIIFLLVVLTGLISMMFEDSHIGLLHSKLGELLIIVGIMHLISRFKSLIKLFKRRTNVINEVQ